jgi:cell wall-associated NlpC family hydrolase
MFQLHYFSRTTSGSHCIDQMPLSQAKAGDLVFFHSTYNAGSYVTHVGILVSPTQMYHAGDPIGYADLSSSYWQQHLIGAGRVKQ